MKNFAQKMLATALLVASSSLMAAPVATLESVQGSVVVERSGEMLPASTGFQLQQGDSVRALENGTATVSFGNCNVPMTNSTMFSVDAAQQCSAEAQQIGTGAVFLAALGPAAAAAVVVATVTVVSVVANENTDDEPASP